MKKKEEYCNKCDNCKKKKLSRIFYQKINGIWIWLCKDCWKEIETKLKNKPSESL